MLLFCSVLVAAIDFGSSDSGCAFSLRSDYESDPINTIHTESLGGNSSKTQKSPTVVLMNPDGEFAAFGKKAEQQYEELALDDEDKKWFYFTRFKMQLFTKKGLNKDMMLEDINGRKMKALDVFACCIEYIKNKVFKRAEEGVSNLQEDEVHWMITVPAIWNESARQFIIAAATKAGINPVLLSLVLEPEAAAVFCKYVAIRSSKDGKEAKLEVFESGSQFVIVDLGGGTVDITCNEVTETGQLQEIYHASGGPWGGNMINLRIWKLIRSVIGNATFDACMEESTYLKLCMLKEIEEGKMKMKSNEKATFKLPFEFSNKKIEYKGAEIIKDKIHIDPDVISKVFEYAIEQVCSHLSKVLARDETRNVKYLLLVGGYASCEILKETIKKKFNTYDIIHPCNNPEMIVLNGAVIMGHESRPIIGRLARYHYGLAVPSGLRIIPKKETTMHTEFDHEPTFLPLICKGTPIRIGKKVAQYSFIVTSEELTDIEIGILTCEDDKAPSSIAENSCNKIGQIVAKFPALIKNSKMTIIISCDETEFKVTAVIDELGHSFSARCSFLL
ncbi:Hypothetical predicted protein [Mytilus galloprovincialis]|uniref:Uncharacterized protein n=1 Tax=Mytilus galloprovincialis TaxID=29158 RepID=A0A8B6EWR5_MYTGA|nr:Hypothetical predicted protein [Mytilus galloprovincialis]